MIIQLCGLNINMSFIFKTVCRLAFIFFFGNICAVMLSMQKDPLAVLPVQALPTCFAYRQRSGVL